MIIIGIDPGLEGGIAIYNTKLEFFSFHRMPVIDRKIDINSLKNILHRAEHIFIEEISIRSNQKGAIVTGMNAGRVDTIAELALRKERIPVYVKPQNWYKLFNLKVKKTSLVGLRGQARLDALEKNKPSLKYCRENNIKIPKKTVSKDDEGNSVVIPADGCADALLILLYGRAKYKI